MTSRLRALARSELGRRLAVATLSSGVVWAAGTASTFAVGVVLARSLGPAGYGIYGTAIAVVTLLAVPAQFGLPLLATREVSKARVRGQPADVAVLGWWFAAIVAGASILLALALRVADSALPLALTLKPALAAAAALLPALALSGLTSGLLRGQERVVISQLLDVLVRPLLFLAALFLWAHPIGPSQAISAQITAAATITLLGFGLFFRGLPRTVIGGGRHLRTWFGAALPMTMMEAMRALEGSYAVLVAGYAVSIADAGLLRVAIASSAIILLPISLQNIVTGPFLASAHAAGETRRLARIVAASTLFMTAGVAGVMIVLAIAGQWALPFAFGHGFAGAYAPLMILGGNQLLLAGMGPNTMLLSMTGHEKTVARAFILAVLAAVVAAMLLTPMLGILGTAGSTLVATAIRGILLNRRARHALGVAPSVLGAIALLSGRPGPRRSDDAFHRSMSN